jgi:hypothetical protein
MGSWLSALAACAGKIVAGGIVTDLPVPLTPADCDLRDFPFMPLDIARLFNSEFHARANDSEWRAGITLWLKSFHQVPAGSIPDDEVSLARLAELGRDVKSWKKVKDVALYGWVKCSDGRLYHPVVAEKAAEAWAGKKAQRARTAKARLQAMLTRLSKASDLFEFAQIEFNIQTLLSELSQHLLHTEMESVRKSVTDSVAETKRKREGKGQGKGKDNSDPNGSDAGASGKSPEEMTKDELWSAGKSVLMAAGVPKDQCGSFVGGLVKQYGDQTVIEAVRATVIAGPADPKEYMKACCQKRAGERQNKQESLEAKNQAVAAELAGETE